MKDNLQNIIKRTCIVFKRNTFSTEKMFPEILLWFYFLHFSCSWNINQREWGRLTAARCPHRFTLPSLASFKHTKHALFLLQPMQHSWHRMCGMLYNQTLTSPPIPDEFNLALVLPEVASAPTGQRLILPTRRSAVLRTATSACCHLPMVVTIQTYIRCHHNSVLRTPENCPFATLHTDTESDSRASGWRSAHDLDMGTRVERLLSAVPSSAAQKLLEPLHVESLGGSLVTWAWPNALVSSLSSFPKGWKVSLMIPGIFSILGLVFLFFWSPAPRPESS